MENRLENRLEKRLEKRLENRLENITESWGPCNWTAEMFGPRFENSHEAKLQNNNSKQTKTTGYRIGKLASADAKLKINITTWWNEPPAGAGETWTEEEGGATIQWETKRSALACEIATWVVMRD